MRTEQAQRWLRAWVLAARRVRARTSSRRGSARCSDGTNANACSTVGMPAASSTLHTALSSPFTQRTDGIVAEFSRITPLQVLDF